MATAAARNKSRLFHASSFDADLLAEGLTKI
jgi:hypothetical protein